MSDITFKVATKEDEQTIFSWLSEPHMVEFWDNSQEHKDDISNFIHGREQHYFSGKTKYFIGCIDDVPFAFLLGEAINFDDSLPELSKQAASIFGNVISVDFGIGNVNYLGKGLASETLEKFLLYYQENIDPRADTFFIDPDEDNPRAKHVYEKSGFLQIGKYKPKEGAFVGHTNLSMIKKIPLNVAALTPQLVEKLIADQFPEYAHESINSIEFQGHDNRTFRLGDSLLVRMPTAESYALKVPIEQAFLPKLADYLPVAIPSPIKMGKPCADYTYPFSIYKWIAGRSANHLQIKGTALESIAHQLSAFLKALHSIKDVEGPEPGQHNWWRGDHVSVYDVGAREQIRELTDVIDSAAALHLWKEACKTEWQGQPVWIHGDFAAGNILIQDSAVSGVIDFGGMGTGDPACDLVIAWTYLSGEARNVFIRNMDFDAGTWLRAKAWALWKATFELVNISNKSSEDALHQISIIDGLVSDVR